jgi:hypothetical protein
VALFNKDPTSDMGSVGNGMELSDWQQAQLCYAT